MTATSEASATEGPMSKRDHITVLHSVAGPDGTTRFIVQLVEGAPPGLELKFFSWPRAIFGSYDVFHVHWPEFLIRSRFYPWTLVQRLLFIILLVRLRLQKIPLVRTLHNVKPHEPGGRFETALLERADRMTSLFIRLNPTTVSPPGQAVTILHGHYVDRFADLEKAKAVSGRVLYFGLIRPYKGVLPLISAFRELTSEGVTLRVVGSPTDELRVAVEAAVANDHRASCLLEFVDDQTLVHEITEAKLVVLPYLEMHNSGALLVALSLGRPVLAPDTTSNRALVDEVGPEWLMTFTGELTPEILGNALAAAESLSATDRPDLSGRDWGHIGELHYAAYTRTLRERSASRS